MIKHDIYIYINFHFNVKSLFKINELKNIYNYTYNN